MKIRCEIIRDLLFLYDEDGCSMESRKLVEEHLKGCKECRNYQKKMRFPEEMMAEKLEGDSRREEKAIKNSFKKVRRRWLVSLVAVLMVFPTIGVGMMGYNEHVGEGICFTNLDEIVAAKKLLTLIEKGEYAKAAQMLRAEYEMDYASIIESINDTQGKNEPKLQSVEERAAYTLNGEVWRLSVDMGKFFKEGSGLEEYEMWKNAIYGGRWGLLIPEEIWDEVIDKEDVSVCYIDEMKIFQLNDDKGLYPPVDGALCYSRDFCLMETDYGNYYANGPLAEYLGDGAVKSEADIYRLGCMVPESIARVAIEQLNEQSIILANSTEIVFGPVRDMTEDEFCEFMQQKFVDRMNEYTQEGSSFELGRFRSAQRTEREWEICFDIDETYADGSVQEYGLIVDVCNGEITGIRSLGGPDLMIDEVYAVNGAANVVYWENPLKNSQ